MAFARRDLAAGEFPLAGEMAARGPLRDQDFLAALNDGCYNLLSVHLSPTIFLTAMPSGLLEQLSDRILLSDGAIGTRLQALTRNYDGSLDALNIDKDFAIRGLVRKVHESYRDAGSDILQTNTYGANPVKLAYFGLEDKVREINFEGACIARAVAGKDLLVAGSVGPMERAPELEGWRWEDVEAGFRVQMDALVDGGVDFLILETFQELKQARVAMRIAKSYGMPVVFQMGGVQGGKTSTGVDVVSFALEMQELGADLLGANCRGPFDVLRTIEILAASLSVPLSAQPNAGSPEIDRGRIVYSIRLEDFVRYSERIVEAGANLLGGCCGTDPSHILRLREIVHGRRPTPRRKVEPRVALPETRAQPAAPVANRIQKLFHSGDPLVSVEIRPSRDTTFAELLEGTLKVVEAGASLLDIPDNAGGNVAFDPMVTGVFLQEKTGLPVIMHLNSTSRNLIALQSYLLGCWQEGIQGILAITGDHPNVGDHDKYAHRVNDLKSSVELIQVIGMLNQGKLFNESPIRTPCGFSVGAAVNPTRNLEPQLRWLRRKVEAGAGFCFSQPVYLKEDAERLYEKAASWGIRIFTGILPITSVRNADFLASGRIPGISVPAPILELFHEARSPAEAKSLGLRLAEDLIAGLAGVAQGFYLILPFGKTRYEDTARLVRQARQALKQ